MWRIVVFCVVGVVVAVAAVTVQRRDDATAVRRIADGDTLTMGSGARVRLLQIDTPELEGECYAEEAADALRELAPPGTVVRLEEDERLDRVDRFGRLLRYVFVEDTNVNLELVRRGAATVYFYRGDRGRYAPELLEAARAARAQERGLWGACRGAVWDPEAAAATGS